MTKNLVPETVKTLGGEMPKVPFSAYDVFGCLIPGFILIAAVDFAVGKHWLFTDNPGVVLIFFWTITAYIIGQILSGASYSALEKGIVGRWLRKPSVNLFNRHPNYWIRLVFSGYCKLLPNKIRSEVRQKAKTRGITKSGEVLFLHAFGKVKQQPDLMARLATFLYLYGFCRATSLALILAALILLIASVIHYTLDKTMWGLIAVAAAVGMFYRYLMFYRLYSQELFMTYAELPLAGGPNGNQNTRR